MQLDHVVDHHASTLLVVDGCAIQLELHELNGPVPGLDDWREASACVLQPLLQLTWSFMLRWDHVMHGAAKLTMDLQIERNLRASAVMFSPATIQQGKCIGVNPGIHGNEQTTCIAPLRALLLLASATSG